MLTFDGTQNYVNFGNMGSLGSNLGTGAYISFQMKTTSTALVRFGVLLSATGIGLQVGFNASSTETLSAGHLYFFLRDASNKVLRASTTSTINFNDGNLHTIAMSAVGSTNTITILVDGNSLPITYGTQGTPVTFTNLTTSLYIGARNSLGTADSFVPCTIGNLSIGTSSSSIYGSWAMSDGSGTSVADSSGNANTGTLVGSPLPQWGVSGILLGAL